MVENAYKVTLAGAFVPLFFGAFWKRATTQGALAAIFGGVGSGCSFEVLVGEASPVPPQLIGLWHQHGSAWWPARCCRSGSATACRERMSTRPCITRQRRKPTMLASIRTTTELFVTMSGRPKMRPRL